MFKIEKNVPVPTGYKSKYPFNEMRAGDSFLVPVAEAEKLVVRTRIVSATRKRAVKYPGEEYVVRYDDGGIRVWRIA